MIWLLVRGYFIFWIVYRGCFYKNVYLLLIVYMIRKKFYFENNNVGNCYFECKLENGNYGGCVNNVKFFFGF